MSCGARPFAVPNTAMKTPQVAITTTLFRIGAHIGAAKCPRTFSTAPMSADRPVKKMIGRIRYANSVTRCWYSSVPLVAWIAVISGAAATINSVAIPRPTTANVRSFWVYA